jgi:hypothetical protein
VNIHKQGKKCDDILEKKTNKQHRDKKYDRLQVIVRARNQGWTSKIGKGCAHLEIVKEEGEFMPRAVQTRGRSADGHWLA